MHRSGRNLAVPRGRGIRAVNLLIHIPHCVEVSPIRGTEDCILFQGFGGGSGRVGSGWVTKGFAGCAGNDIAPVEAEVGAVARRLSGYP